MRLIILRYVGITYLVFVLVMFVACYFTSLLTERIRGQIQKECSLALQLAQATKLSAIGEFAGYIMHEINNPLGIIEMRVKMLLSELTDNSRLKIKNDLEIVSKQVSRIAYLTKELLNYARPHTKKREGVNIREVIMETINSIHGSGCTNNIEIETKFEQNLQKVDGNFNELQQVLSNIINNAIDAMPDGGKILISACNREMLINNRNVNGIQIQISDTGIGIPPENMKNIFTPFFTTKGIKGIGLGLAWCRSVVKNHDGKIWAESEPGKGATFYVFLPYCSSSTDQPVTF